MFKPGHVLRFEWETKRADWITLTRHKVDGDDDTQVTLYNGEPLPTSIPIDVLPNQEDDFHYTFTASNNCGSEVSQFVARIRVEEIGVWVYNLDCASGRRVRNIAVKTAEEDGVRADELKANGQLAWRYAAGDLFGFSEAEHYTHGTLKKNFRRERITCPDLHL